jgi:hypothetical protein
VVVVAFRGLVWAERWPRNVFGVQGVWDCCFWEEANRFDFPSDLSVFHLRVRAARRRRASRLWRAGGVGGGEVGPAKRVGRGASGTVAGCGRAQVRLPVASGRRVGLRRPAAVVSGVPRLLLITGVLSMAEGLVRLLVADGAPSVVVAAGVAAWELCRVPAVVTGLRRWRRFSSRGGMGKMW